MSALSNRDFYREFGKGILVYPFTASNIKGASVNLTVSEFVWNINTKERIMPQSKEGSDGKKILIPPHTPVAIMTREAIYVSENICGTYHSRVSKVSQGFSHISTTLDPKYFGTSLVSFINNTDEPKELVVTEAFVTVVFYYLKNDTLKTTSKGQNMDNRVDIVSQFAHSADFIRYTRENNYLTSADDLGHKMRTDNDFQKWRNSFSINDKELRKKTMFKKIAFHVTIILAMSLFVFGFMQFLIYQENIFMLDTGKVRTEIIVIFFTSLLYAMRVFYTNIYKKWFKRSLRKMDYKDEDNQTDIEPADPM